MIEATLNVELGERSYPIHIGRALAESICECLAANQRQGRKVAVVTDRSVADSQMDFLAAAFGETPTLVVPAGESSKCFQQLQAVCDFFAASKLDRKGCVYAVGGGVVGDLVGFASASYLRGIGFYQVPTTLLAMVDSSVGGKTGINLCAGKNLVGAFHQPEAVFADLDTLKTLPPAEFASGMAEVIKHGLLADAALFADLETEDPLTPDSPLLAEFVYRNCAIKSKVVAADERELDHGGGRALLNLGHTFGHAIEAVAGYGCYLHGEAVAIGLCLAAQLSDQLKWTRRPVAARTQLLVQRYGLPVRLRTPLPVAALLEASTRDKKVIAGKNRYILLREIGLAAVAEGIPSRSIEALWLQAGAA